jgi:hypothetical protein
VLVVKNAADLLLRIQQCLVHLRLGLLADLRRRIRVPATDLTQLDLLFRVEFQVLVQPIHDCVDDAVGAALHHLSYLLANDPSVTATPKSTPKKKIRKTPRQPLKRFIRRLLSVI